MKEWRAEPNSKARFVFFWNPQLFQDNVQDEIRSRGSAFVQDQSQSFVIHHVNANFDRRIRRYCWNLSGEGKRGRGEERGYEKGTHIKLCYMRLSFRPSNCKNLPDETKSWSRRTWDGRVDMTKSANWIECPLVLPLLAIDFSSALALLSKEGSVTLMEGVGVSTIVSDDDCCCCCCCCCCRGSALAKFHRPGFGFGLEKDLAATVTFSGREESVDGAAASKRGVCESGRRRGMRIWNKTNSSQQMIAPTEKRSFLRRYYTFAQGAHPNVVHRPTQFYPIHRRRPL